MDAIVQVIEDWSHAKDQKETIHAIFFDFSKAFDLVDHEVLLIKLEQFLPAWLTSWIASYLSNRKQRVVMNGFETEWKPVEAGVVQGSVLGPILFLLFIHDINEYIPPNVTLQKYADDILAYIIGKSIDATLPQQVADGIKRWCTVNKMRLNEDKCKAMTIGDNNNEALPTVKLSSDPMEIVPSYKYLGIEINNNLEWDHQWTRVQMLTRSVPYLIKTLKRQGFRQNILVNIYQSKALSHFTYSAPLLANANTKIKAEMASFQRRILKIIGITPEYAQSRYKINTIEEHIDNTSCKLLRRILAEVDHPLTRRVPRINSKTNHTQFKTNKPKTTAYSNSFVQKYLRVIRDGTQDLYKPRSLNNYNTIKVARQPITKPPVAAISKKPKTPKEQCAICGKLYAIGAGMAIHTKRAHVDHPPQNNLL